jgi:hypothetical protein
MNITSSLENDLVFQELKFQETRVVLARKLYSDSTTCLQYTSFLLYQIVFLFQIVSCTIIIIKCDCVKYIAGLQNITLTSQSALRDIL